MPDIGISLSNQVPVPVIPWTVEDDPRAPSGGWTAGSLGSGTDFLQRLGEGAVGIDFSAVPFFRTLAEPVDAGDPPTDPLKVVTAAIKDLDGTLILESTRRFLMWAVFHKPKEITSIFYRLGIRNTWDVAVGLARFGLFNNLTTEEGLALFKRISAGFPLVKLAIEWIKDQGHKDIFDFTFRTLKQDFKARKIVVVVSANAQIIPAMIALIMGASHVTIVDPAEGTEEVFNNIVRPALESLQIPRKLNQTSPVYVLASPFELDSEGVIKGVKEWIHGEAKGEKVAEFVKKMGQKGIVVKLDQSSVEYDKPSDRAGLGREVTDWTRHTIINPHGIGTAVFVAKALHEGSRVVQTDTQLGDVIQRGRKFFRALPDGNEKEIPDITKALAEAREKKIKGARSLKIYSDDPVFAYANRGVVDRGYEGVVAPLMRRLRGASSSVAGMMIFASLNSQLDVSDNMSSLQQEALPHETQMVRRPSMRRPHVRDYHPHRLPHSARVVHSSPAADLSMFAGTPAWSAVGVETFVMASL